MVGGPGSRSKVGFAVGVAAAIVGAVGYFGFGWRFGTDPGTPSWWIGAVVAVVAFGLVVYRYLSA